MIKKKKILKNKEKYCFSVTKHFLEKCIKYYKSSGDSVQAHNGKRKGQFEDISGTFLAKF